MILLTNTQADVTLNVWDSEIIAWENKAPCNDLKYDTAYKSNCTHQTNKIWSDFLSIDLWSGTKYFYLIILVCNIINEYTMMHKDRLSKKLRYMLVCLL